MGKENLLSGPFKNKGAIRFQSPEEGVRDLKLASILSTPSLFFPSDWNRVWNTQTLWLILKLFLKKGFLYLALLACPLFLHPYSIVFVHIGPFLPSHVPIALSQARLFNKTCPIYLIANTGIVDGYSKRFEEAYHVTCISCESLPISKEHRRFRQLSRLDRISANGYWFHTVERFFYIDSFINAYQLTDVFHLENDVMLYADLERYIPILKDHYSNMIGATFENDDRCCPGLLYISSSDPMRQLIRLFAEQASLSEQDMHMIASFKNLYKKTWIDHLPTIPNCYLDDHPELKTKEPESYCNHIETFASIFDAAAIGIYLGGMDSCFHWDCSPGIDSPYSLSKPSHFQYIWEKDRENRLIPFLIYKEKKFPINNLHITCKKLTNYHSLREEHP